MKSRLPKKYQNAGVGNMNQMVRKAQKMQEDITRVEEELAQREFTKTVGGGALELVMTGSKELKSVKLSPDAVNPDDVEMLEDLIVSGVNEILREIEDVSSAEIEKVTGGVSMPGIF